MANPLIRTEGHLFFAWCIARVTLEDLKSHKRVKFGDKGLKHWNILKQNGKWLALTSD